MVTNQENIEILEKIYTRILKARDAYENASKNVHNKLLTNLFEKATIMHSKFADELKQEISSLGRSVKEGGSSTLNADQFWLDFASIIVLRNESAILKNCLKAEKKAIELYDEALAHDSVTGSLREKLEAQRKYAANLSVEIADLETKYSSD
ncbi:PA2169 family four-helix-bundle protein [Catalinimonas niigatensis]|uniref:PA2169 family four-helix-bundle protein n=1 Tax=Catalinimonas niigatensis TaxID=1397264 RepID=UPI002665501D|nr:PA2169 family four-helix-bundle protein [Catalinimonas niigatensis]WPP49013.1 PA2169 family four-helix-bundle protein [Catalinimonas niigatensis]